MTPENSRSLINEIHDLLDTEKDALIQGQLELLGPLAARKENLISELSAAASESPEKLDQFQEKLARNQLLLNSAMQGVKAVADRLSNLQRVRQGLETYDSTGRKSRVGNGAAANVEKRA